MARLEDCVDEYAGERGYADKSFFQKLAFVDQQWGAFFTWLREKHPVRVIIDVHGGVATVREHTPSVEVEIVDHD